MLLILIFRWLRANCDRAASSWATILRSIDHLCSSEKRVAPECCFGVCVRSDCESLRKSTQVDAAWLRILVRLLLDLAGHIEHLLAALERLDTLSSTRWLYRVPRVFACCQLRLVQHRRHARWVVNLRRYIGFFAIVDFTYYHLATLLHVRSLD